MSVYPSPQQGEGGGKAAGGGGFAAGKLFAVEKTSSNATNSKQISIPRNSWE
jgi:hypothetical protein